jgi:uncharacterized protein with HEPN domain
MSKDNDYLGEILNAGKAIERFIEGLSQETFLANDEKNTAVKQQFEIIGDAVRNIPLGTTPRLAWLSWWIIRNIRKIPKHGFEAMDLNTLWDMAQRDAPRLVVGIESYLSTPPRPSG